MATKRNIPTISADLKFSQWRFLTDIIDDVCIALDASTKESKSLLALYEIDRLRPLLVSDSGQDFVDTSASCPSSLANSAIRFQLGERRSFIQSDSTVEEIAAGHDFAIPIPVLNKWLADHNLNFQIDHWVTWTRDCLPVIEKAGLLYSSICVNEFTPPAIREPHGTRQPVISYGIFYTTPAAQWPH